MNVESKHCDSLAPPAPLKEKGSGESLYIEVWSCRNAGGTNQIAAVVQL